MPPARAGSAWRCSPSRSSRSPRRRPGASRDDLRLLSEIYAYVALASLWNLLAGYAGLRLGRPAGLCRARRLCAVRATILVGDASARRRAGRGRDRGRSSRCRSPGLMFRLRGHYFAIGTWVVAEVFRLLASQISALGGGSGISLPAGIVTSMALEPADARVPDLLDRARPRGRWCSPRSCCCCARATALRSPQSATTSWRRDRTASTSRAPSSSSMSLTAFGTAMVGALIFLQKLRISPGHRLQRQRLDRLRHLHHRDRRHRAGGGADHRHRSCSSCCGRRSPISAASIC